LWKRSANRSLGSWERTGGIRIGAAKLAAIRLDDFHRVRSLEVGQRSIRRIVLKEDALCWIALREDTIAPMNDEVMQARGSAEQIREKALAAMDVPLLECLKGQQPAYIRSTLARKLADVLDLWTELLRSGNAPIGPIMGPLAKKVQRRIESLRAAQQLVDRVWDWNVLDVLAKFDTEAKLLDPNKVDAFVMSIDIRRSTDLMLEAREPQLFSDFIQELAAGLYTVVKRRGGVADKFTGDGLLAFFPPFLRAELIQRYQGDVVGVASKPPLEMGRQALEAASECHLVFDQLYAHHAHHFHTHSSHAGLGIGIDYGSIHTVAIDGTPTIIGPPVVYACRLNSGAAGDTLLNVGAWHELRSLEPEFSFDQKLVSLKTGNTIEAWRVSRGRGQRDGGA
jgi:class 3 adenylate cyclase